VVVAEAVGATVGDLVGDNVALVGDNVTMVGV